MVAIRYYHLVVGLIWGVELVERVAASKTTKIERFCAYHSSTVDITKSVFVSGNTRS
jgi:hypothetical protein